MYSVNKTLYIPLYGKAYVSTRGLILRDPKAEQIWASEGFPLRGKAASKWLAYDMGMRAAVIDRWVESRLEAEPEAVVLHLGCGMDSRAERVKRQGQSWFDVDFPDVIRERERYYSRTDGYRMLGSDIRIPGWLEEIPGGTGIVVMEGVSMYLKPEELTELLGGLKAHFDRLYLLMDCYSSFAARASRYKNPVNDVGVTEVYGLDDPRTLERGTGLSYVREHEMTPETMIRQLPRGQQAIFRRLYAGGFAKKLYRLYEFQ